MKAVVGGGGSGGSGRLAHGGGIEHVAENDADKETLLPLELRDPSDDVVIVFEGFFYMVNSIFNSCIL